MSYWYKETNVRDYVVALNSEYNVSIPDTDQMVWEAEDQAYDIIEEVLKQRIQGVKNESGVWVTPAFPKLIYVLEEQNIHDHSPYFYLT